MNLGNTIKKSANLSQLQVTASTYILIWEYLVPVSTRDLDT